MAGTQERWAALPGTEIVVPGSASNLGPGFDTLGLALRLYLRVRVVAVEPHADGGLVSDFVGGTLVGENRVEQGFRLLAERHRAPSPRVRVEIRSDIPLRSGLGSSAAAAIAGFRLFEALHGARPIEELLSAAARLEGHADNAAASLLGGLTGCCEIEPGRFAAWSRRWPDDLHVIVATPEAQVETREARRVLPDRVSLADAVFNLQRAAWLLQALDGNRALLPQALRDRWHQPYRAPLVPAWDRLAALRHPDLLGVCISGSGPSVVGFAVRDAAAAEDAMRAEYAAAGVRAAVRTVPVHQP